jgi:hypothetical protein
LKSEIPEVPEIPVPLSQIMPEDEVNGVNSVAVVNYVEAQMAYVGGGCSICREDVFLPEEQFTITKSQAIILGKHVKLYIEFRANYDNLGTQEDNSLVGTSKDDIPQPDSDVDIILNNGTLTMTGVELRIWWDGDHTIIGGDTFKGMFEWGGVETATGGTTPQYIETGIISDYPPWSSVGTVGIVLDKLVVLLLDVYNEHPSASYNIGTQTNFGTLLEPFKALKRSSSCMFVNQSAVGLVVEAEMIYATGDTTIEPGKHIYGTISYLIA